MQGAESTGWDREKHCLQEQAGAGNNMDTAPNALSPDVNSFVPSHAPPHHTGDPPTRLPPYIILVAPTHSPLASPRPTHLRYTNGSNPCSLSSMEASPSRSDSLSRGGWPRCRARPAPSLERLDVHAGGLGESFSSSTASFIDMDPEELFSMRWTSSDDGGLDLGPPCAGSCSPLLASAGLVFADGGLLPRAPSGIIAARDSGGACYADASAGSSPAFHTARSTPAPAVGSARRPGGGARPLLPATRRLLLRYLRFLVPLCRKARALRLPARVFSAPRSTRPPAAATPARRSTSSASSAAEHWCHGNADTAVRDAILHCKKSLLAARTEC
ncbi:putative membrane-associated kinase regulator 6 [Panicum miliaceum]|uniref:Membrane-associated kinase regulator 6 n=1 Tax=Panicum miliaceum TaxID=4540 RepID=A0A3L6TTH8_PANMI|nr:putative membrane-associated kinase regulator 6 [Panicum miliaceum]